MSSGKTWAARLCGTRVDELLRAAVAELVDMALGDLIERVSAVLSDAPELRGLRSPSTGTARECVT